MKSSKYLYLLVFSTFILLQNAKALNYYWVGGTGNWDELSHWVTTSGGTVHHTQIPTAVDDIYFDANSGFTATSKTVSLNQPMSFCKNMNWTGAMNNPIFKTIGGDPILYIFGSLTLIPAMDILGIPSIIFSSTSPGNTITTATKHLRFITFDGVGGSWTLQDSIWCFYTLDLKNGSLNTNNQIVDVGQFTSDYVNVRGLNLGSSLVRIYTDWTLNHTNLTFNAGISLINFSNAGTMRVAGVLPATYYDVIINSTSGATIANLSGSNQFSFHNVTINSDCSFRGDNSFNILNLTAGKNYQFYPGTTQTIVSSLNAIGNCNNVITFQSYTPGSQAKISKSSGALTVDYVALKDMAAIGGGSFTAYHSVDMGNNSGWTINAPAQSARYWVGGGGDWGDPAHWSLTSGGTGGSCIPSANDDVYFDAGSGFISTNKKVTCNQHLSFCRNMNWTGAANNPILDRLGVVQLYIYGSLTLVPSMTTGNMPFVTFASRSSGNTITSAGNPLYSANFDGVGGGWTFVDQFSTYTLANLINGSLNTNNQTLDIGQFQSQNSNVRSLNLGTSLVKARSGWYCFHNNLNFNAGTSKIEIISGLGSFYVTGSTPVTYYDVSINPASPVNVTFNNLSNNVEFTFHDVSIKGNNVMSGINTFNNLTLAPGYFYQFQAGKTQKIINGLNITGNCNSIISLQSATDGTQATISKASGSVLVDYVMLKDMNATGGASFTASHAVDQGDNSGWIFNASTPGARYWVGGGGNWTDAAHWSLTSGGAGGACIPSPYDDVYFDANSGFTSTSNKISFDQPTSFCKNMDWTGATNTPGFNAVAGSPVLYIYGSLTLIQAMNTANLPLLSFVSTVSGNTITTAGRHIGNINFDGAGGGWTLQDSLYVNSTLKLVRGSLNSNGKTLDLGYFSSESNNIRSLILGSSLVKIYYDWRCDHTNMSFDAGTSTINMTSPNLTREFWFRGNLPVTYNKVLQNYSLTSFLKFTNAGIVSIKFHEVYLNSKSLISGSSTFDNLYFIPGVTYQVQSGTTQTITNKLTAQGNCTSYILLASTIAGTAANLSKNGGFDSVYFVHVQDMNATGGVAFRAYNSVDLGGNTNWSFLTLPALGNAGSITGPTSVCSNNVTATYQISMVAGASGYTWAVPAGVSIVSGQGSNVIVVSFSAGFISGNITVAATDGCTFSNQQSITVTAGSAPPQPGIITGNNTVCAGSSQTYSIAAVAGATSYTWTLPSGWSGNSVTNTINTIVGSISGDILVTANNGCSSPAQTLSVTVTPLPAQPGYINGDSVICNGGTNVYSIYPVPGATSYTWTLPPGWIGSSTTNTITVTVGAGASPGYISVTANNSCGSSAPQTKYVFVGSLPAQPGSIIGADTVCMWSQQTYTVNPVPGAQSYTWTIPNGWYGNSNSNSITVFVGASGGIISVTANNSCGISPVRNLLVTVDSIPDHPGAINGDAIVSVGDTRNYSINAVNGADGYNWFLSGGGIITTDPHLSGISIGWTTPGSYTLYVSAFNHCGNSDTSHLNITVNPGIQGVRVIPTISNSDFHIEFNAINNRQVSIEVVDMLGHVVFTRQQKIVSSGNNVLLQLGHLPSGIYRLKVIVDGKTGLQSDKTVYYQMIVKSG